MVDACACGIARRTFRNGHVPLVCVVIRGSSQCPHFLPSESAVSPLSFPEVVAYRWTSPEGGWWGPCRVVRHGPHVLSPGGGPRGVVRTMDYTVSVC